MLAEVEQEPDSQISKSFGPRPEPRLKNVGIGAESEFETMTPAPSARN